MSNLAYLGMACALCLSALGSGLGAGCASLASVGGWKKCYANGKPAPFSYTDHLWLPAHELHQRLLCKNR